MGRLHNPAAGRPGPDLRRRPRYQASSRQPSRRSPAAQADHQQREAARQRGSRRPARCLGQGADEAKRKAEARNARVAESPLASASTTGSPSASTCR